jgi:hypothetical protein
MDDVFGSAVVLFFVISCIFIVVKCSNTIEEHEQNIRKYNQQQIETCFPALFVQEVEIDGIKYEICRSEPGSKDFKLKEFVK